MWPLSMVHVLPKHKAPALLTHVPLALKLREYCSTVLFAPLIFLHLFQGSVEALLFFSSPICLTCPFIPDLQ